ncbi:MAG TPA: outer membrane lipoprotein-sorting protein [Kiritimatiellia bacterium]
MLLLCLFSAAPALAGHEGSSLPPAQELLDGCIATLPDIPLLIQGQLQSKNSDGDIEEKINVEMLLDWQAQPPTARYTLRDAFGAALEHLAVTWNPGAGPEYRYFVGDPLAATAVPELSAPVRGTDISWMDLSLSFLWWPDGTTVGAEEVRSRACYVVDAPAPGGVFAGCKGARLWIDPQIHILLRADAYGTDGNVMRRMEVKSFKKINGRWVIQNIEIESYPSRHRTVLRVRDVQDRTRKSFIREDAGGEDVESVEPVPGV